MDRLVELASRVPGALSAQLQYREMQTAIRTAAWLVILFHGEPDLVGSLVGLIGRIAS